MYFQITHLFFIWQNAFPLHYRGKIAPLRALLVNLRPIVHPLVTANMVQLVLLLMVPVFVKKVQTSAFHCSIINALSLWNEVRNIIEKEIPLTVSIPPLFIRGIEHSLPVILASLYSYYGWAWLLMYGEILKSLEDKSHRNFNNIRNSDINNVPICFLRMRK